MSTETFQATGRRKNSVARVQMSQGSGKVFINQKTIDEFFGGLERQKKAILTALAAYPSANTFDFVISVNGGGVTGQAGAVVHGIARAILKGDPSTKAVLKKEGLFTRDSRMVERKKPGRPKARKRFQYSKR